MTDQQQNQERAWTPGPWRVGSDGEHVLCEVAGTGRWVSCDAEIPDDIGPPADADAALIALAPELAEAVMMWQECPCDRQCNDCGDRLIDAADKLRQIGGAS